MEDAGGGGAEEKDASAAAADITAWKATSLESTRRSGGSSSSSSIHHTNNTNSNNNSNNYNNSISNNNEDASFSFYTKEPKDEQEARENFRQVVLDKALETSVTDWPEHINNHDATLRRYHPRKSGALSSSTKNNSSAFMTVSVRSTLRQRISSNSVQPITTPDNDNVGIIDSKITTPTTDEEGGSSSNTTKEGRKKGVPYGWENYYHRHIQLLVSLALFSYVGEYLRWFFGYIFGRACQHQNTIFWDVSGWNICTTNDGLGSGTGGSFFTDLPGNMFGCFLMGLMVSGDGESIAVNLPMAALPRSCFFQGWIVTHVGLRTGLCGAFTTFASWNTQMVQMICNGSGTKLHSQWVSALWGYVVGLYTSLESYRLGTACAYALSRYFNKSLALEADTIIDKKAIGVLINRDLGDFERRFLHDICLNEDEKIQEEEKERQQQENTERFASSQQRRSSTKYGTTNTTDSKNKNRTSLKEKYGSSCHKNHFDDHIHHLHAWKISTDVHRDGKKKEGDNNTTATTKKENYVKELQEIEKNLLVDKVEPRQELLEIARDAGWNVDALRNWTSALDHEEQKRIFVESGGTVEDFANNINIEDAYFFGGGDGSAGSSSTTPLWEVVLTLLLFLSATILLIAGYVYFKDEHDPLVPAEQFLSALLAPLGTYSRWYLSRLNGRINRRNWEWLPIGTFLANMIASVLSALAAAITSKLADDQLVAKQVLYAIKFGYAGSFSTVSTFAAETTGLFRALPRYFWGYYYSFGSLFCAMVLGVISYVWSVVPKEDKAV